MDKLKQFSLCYVAANSLGRHGGLVVEALVSGSSGPGSRPGQGHFVFLGNAPYSCSASLRPGV